MKYLWIALAAGGLISGCSVENKTEVSQQVEESSLSAVMLNTQTRAPVAKKVPHELTAHSVTRNDNYYWMRDDSRTDKEILAHLDEENSYVETVLAPLKGNREALYEELVSRIEKDDSTVPVFDNGYWYYTRYSGENEYPIYLRKPTLEAEPSVLLDANIMSEGHDYFSIGSYAISSDNKLLAYSEDTLSRRIYTIFVKDLESGDKLNDVLEGTSGRVVWANDNTHLFYVKKDPQTLLGYQVYRHKLGTAQSDDTLIYEESDPTFYTYISKSKDSRVIYIHHNNTDKTGVTLVDANDPTASTEVFLPLKDGQEYSVAKAEDGYYVLTNIDAKNFRIMKAPLDGFSDVSTWQEVVAHRSNVFLQNIEVFKNHLVVKEKENGMLRMVVHNLTSGEEKVIPTQDPIYGAYFNANPQMDTNKLRIFYSSLTTPGSIIDVNLDTLESEIMKQTRVSDTFDSSAYASERVMIEARDGAEVPVSLVYRKDKFKKDGTNPLYQYAYGSYGATIDPTFRSSWLSLIDRGFVVAIAHIRGGQMLGRQWYEDGKMFEKMNTFTDYIDVTKGLVEQQYADKTRVFAMGGSAGGLLMGAVVNMAPELYLGVSAHVPFVDVVTTMSDASIPLTTGEYTEWGNPENKAEFDYMLSYSPYDQVEAKDYPHMLVTTGLHDSQVQYFEPMKWVAKLREYKTDDNLLLFKTDMEAGHGGASGRFKRFESTALEYAFVLYLAGVPL
ncbi:MULTISPECIES: S9 family peptidase [Alteromonas]|jgi:oligopeptidase B|uniref:Protease II n=2 Tax=Alteromonas mediterranea TaxID=314275 RepID=S5AI94_9ALTE|nr:MULTISPECIES: S9 family peptidase [Alteromonas]AGP78511.1 protease II [Alteromonas mediterranea 615]AGP94175.1 protease II [Alteromonas mediterranea U8]MBR9782791.1 S9 family peptidase [Gammaproteobacteria bacterium]AFV86083.1 Protease II [Alteromonas mediterranea DE1]AGP86217.1 protease II [Alteromonas mediterranea U4]|tara:strand:+ start:1032 stop:3209 length:2178 start_codon:yes stop_codon:yes gene_type:complete